MQITYVGLVHDDVEVPAFGYAIVKRGETVNVPDVELALSLLDQPDNWAPADDDAAYYVALKADGAARVAQFADELVEWQAAVEAKAQADAVSDAAFERVDAEVVPPADDKPAPKPKAKAT